MSEPEVTYVNAEPHPDFSMAYRIVEALREAGMHIVTPDPESVYAGYDEVPMVEAIRPILLTLRRYGPSYRLKMEAEEMEAALRKEGKK